VEQTVAAFGGVDVLVNNAGFNDGLGLEASPEQFMSSVRSNLLHVYAMTHHALPYLRTGPGCIVNLGSKVAVTGQGHTSGYAAAKGAINALTREWAVALAPEGIRVNCVLPAECLTDQYERFFQSQANPDAVQKNIGKLVPLEQRLTTPEEIAHTVVFLHPFVPRTPRVNSSSWTADTPTWIGP
jgi:L-fucose dehydrogenase